MTETQIVSNAQSTGGVMVAVVDPDETVRELLIEHIRHFGVGVIAFEDFDTLFTSTDPRVPLVAVVGPSHRERTSFAHVEQLLATRAACGVVMVVFSLSSDLLQRALRAGVADVIEVTADDAELFGAIERAASRIRTLVAASAPTPRPADAAPANRGRVTAVFCTKGGAGKSVIAINLAVALARQTISPVVLVDADLQFGDVALMLGLQPVHTILDAVQAGDRIDGGLLGNLMLRHAASGLFVLAAPTEPESADQIGRDDLARILAVLRENCAHIVIDTSASFGEVTLAALKEADDILVLASLDVMSLKSARVGLQTMQVLGIPFERFKFVLNRANTRVGLTVADAGRALEMKVDVALPSELAVAESVNRGVPILISSPRSKFTKGINELAAMVSTPEPAARKP